MTGWFFLCKPGGIEHWDLAGKLASRVHLETERNPSRGKTASVRFYGLQVVNPSVFVTACNILAPRPTILNISKQSGHARKLVYR